MSKEYVYDGHDNTIDLILKSDGTAQDLSTVTKITASFGDTLVSSEDAAAGAITWAQDGYDTGEIRLSLGNQDITPGLYRNVPIIIYDIVNPNGIVWDTVDILVQGEVEAN